VDACPYYRFGTGSLMLVVAAFATFTVQDEVARSGTARTGSRGPASLAGVGAFHVFVVVAHFDPKPRGAVVAGRFGPPADNVNPRFSRFDGLYVIIRFMV
jgi:hypothetical protein